MTILRKTTARTSIQEILSRAKKPLDITTIIEELKRKEISVDRATVFRVMNAFGKAGIVHKIELQEGKARYELSSLPHHHHAVCTNCGKMQDITHGDISDVEKLVKDELHFTIESHTMEFFGLCEKCSASVK